MHHNSWSSEDKIIKMIALLVIFHFMNKHDFHYGYLYLFLW